jgi:hypothetical protein
MSSGKSYRPSKEAEFGPWAHRLGDYLDMKCTSGDPVWETHIPPDTRTELHAQIHAWDLAYAKALADPSQTNNKEKRRVLKAAIAFIRKLVNDYLRREPVTDEDRDAVGVPNKNPHHAPKPQPVDHVAIALSVDATNHSVRADYQKKGSLSKSKDPYHGVEIRTWLLALDAPAPVTADDPGWESHVDTATPWRWKAKSAADIGKRLYVAMRWENPSAGEDEDACKGPWSAIESVVVA